MGKKKEIRSIAAAITAQRINQIEQGSPKAIQKRARNLQDLAYTQGDLADRSIERAKKADELVEEKPNGFAAKEITSQMLAQREFNVVLGKAMAGAIATSTDTKVHAKEVDDELAKMQAKPQSGQATS